MCKFCAETQASFLLLSSTTRALNHLLAKEHVARRLISFNTCARTITLDIACCKYIIIERCLSASMQLTEVRLATPTLMRGLSHKRTAIGCCYLCLDLRDDLKRLRLSGASLYSGSRPSSPLSSV